MKNNLRVVAGCLILIFCLVDASLAKEWHGIVPLHSTRTDVRRLLGKPLFDENNGYDIYDVDEGRANIMYVRRSCEQGLPSDWGNWNVPRGTVVHITIHLTKPIALAELKIPDIEKYEWYTDDSMTTYYQNKKEGVEYSVQDEMVTSISYGPTEKDGHLICNKKAPKIRY